MNIQVIQPARIGLFVLNKPYVLLYAVAFCQATDLNIYMPFVRQKYFPRSLNILRRYILNPQ
jgi:hypothetical protein